jgi:hypothetical protein
LTGTAPQATSVFSEKHFLGSIKTQDDKDEFTTRQSEKLLQIRDDYESVAELLGGFSVEIVIRKCREARLDLSEDDEEWILQKFDESETTIRQQIFVRKMSRIL